MTAEQVRDKIQSEGLEYFLCSFVEMGGAPKAKLVPATNFDEMSTDGAGFAGFAAGHLGQGPHDTDIMSIPDFRSLTVLPWRNNVAWAGRESACGRRAVAVLPAYDSVPAARSREVEGLRPQGGR